MVIVKNENKTLCLDSKNIVASNSRTKSLWKFFFLQKIRTTSLVLIFLFYNVFQQL